MTRSSPLIDDIPLVLDTSVLINLHASGYGARILAAISNEVIVPELVAHELDRETSRENGEHGFLQELVTLGLVTTASMTDLEQDVYSGLVGGSPSLDDGEASTIAIASSRNLFPIVDERKGRTRALPLIRKEPGWTLDLFLHPQVRAALSFSELVHGVHLALREARMRISERQCAQVVELIGIPRALECRSLPNYKTRYREWQGRLTGQTD